jgi:peptide/nickel transport system permease protein
MSQITASRTATRAQEEIQLRQPSLLARSARRFLRNRGAVFGLAFLISICLLSALAPIVTRWEPQEIDWEAIRKPPSAAHWLGTDLTGRDMFSRLIYGGRVSLLIGLAAVMIRSGIAVVLGSISGYFGGLADFLIQRVVDILMVFPAILMLLILVSIFGPTPLNLLAALGLLSWPFDARIFRSQVLSIRESDYILAAQSIGATNRRIIFRHILPNLLPLVLVNMTLGIGAAIMAEAGISYLGLGVQPPMPSWGNLVMAANNLTLLQRYWWLWVSPGIVLATTVISLNLIGNALHDVFDPHRRV